MSILADKLTKFLAETEPHPMPEDDRVLSFLCGAAMALNPRLTEDEREQIRADIKIAMVAIQERARQQYESRKRN